MSRGFAEAWGKGKACGHQKLAGKGLRFTQEPVEKCPRGKEWLGWEQKTD